MSENGQTDRRRYMQIVGATGIAGVAGCSDLVTDDEGESSTDSRNGDDNTGDDENGESERTEPDLDFENAIRIGHIGPAGNVLGIGSERAAEMAVDSINDAGGIGGEPLELLTGNTRVDQGEAEAVVEEMITQDDVDVIVGGFQSEVVRAITHLTSQFDIPYVSTGAADPSLSEDFTAEDYEQYKNYFRVGPLNRAFQTELVRDYCVHLADRHGWNSLTLYWDQAMWAVPFGNQLPDMLTGEGLDIVEEEAIRIQSPDLSPHLHTTESSDADYMLRFFAHIQSSPAQLLAQWHQDQLEFGIEGIHVPGQHPEYDIATEGLNIYETTGQAGGGGVAPITENTVPFTEQYRERFAEATFDPSTPNGSPMQMGFGTYDAIQVVAEAIESAGVRPTEDLDAFIDAMLGIEHTGVSGEISFFEQDAEYPHDLRPMRNGDGTILNFPVTQVQPNDEDDRPGRTECVFPEPVSTAEHLQPEWMR